MHLKYTLPQTRTRELAHVRTVGRPNAWWPGGMLTNDCVGYQTERLGLRTGHETLAQLSLPANRHFISIAAFRAHYQFPEVPPEQIKPGMLVISNWTGTKINGHLEAEHMEWDYSMNWPGRSLVIVGANTGPTPGHPTPNGVWKKTRPLDGHILFGIELPYPELKPSRARMHEVAVVAAFVNKEVPPGLPRTTAAPGVGRDADTGLEGHNYRVLVQTWGRQVGYYPHPFEIDGIFGDQSELVEKAAYKAATAKK